MKFRISRKNRLKQMKTDENRSQLKMNCELKKKKKIPRKKKKNFEIPKSMN